MESKNLKYACEMYVRHLEESGQKATTVNTARRILAQFTEHFGEEKDVSKILIPHLKSYLDSDKVKMKKSKDGKLVARAEVSYKQIRRVIRMALVWWHSNGWLQTLPLPKEDKRFLEKPEKAKSSKKNKQDTPNTEKSAVKAESDDADAHAIQEPENETTSMMTDPENQPQVSLHFPAGDSDGGYELK